MYRQFAASSTTKPFIAVLLTCAAGTFDVNVTPDKRTVFLHDEDLVCEGIKTVLEVKFRDLQHQEDGLSHAVILDKVVPRPALAVTNMPTLTNTSTPKLKIPVQDVPEISSVSEIPKRIAQKSLLEPDINSETLRKTEVAAQVDRKVEFMNTLPITVVEKQPELSSFRSKVKSNLYKHTTRCSIHVPKLFDAEYISRYATFSTK